MLSFLKPTSAKVLLFLIFIFSTLISPAQFSIPLISASNFLQVWKIIPLLMTITFFLILGFMGLGPDNCVGCSATYTAFGSIFSQLLTLSIWYAISCIIVIISEKIYSAIRR